MEAHQGEEEIEVQAMDAGEPLTGFAIDQDRQGPLEGDVIIGEEAGDRLQTQDAEQGENRQGTQGVMAHPAPLTPEIGQ